ncbi:MAG: ABC transporter substrate-binding protein [Proteobacteria bacterium]|nr:ABC transporter substrate-binding protein [Pseudomonadota bacterium]
MNWLLSRKNICRRMIVFAFALSMFIPGYTSADEKKPKPVKIGVNLYVHHPNIDAVYNGFKEVVDRWAVSKNTAVKYDLQNATGDISIATQIARKQVAEKPNLILAVGTPSVQATKRATLKIPIIFGAMTDPVSAGVVKSMKAPGGNCTGTSDIGPYDEQLQLIRTLLPNARVIGIIRNPGEANSVASIKIIDSLLNKWKFLKVEASVANTSEVLPAAQSLVGRCDIFYMPADNTVLSALDAVINVARANKIPLFVGDEGSVEMGAVATIGIDYLQLGRATGEIAVKVLGGTPPGSIPVMFGAANRLIINLEAARQQGVEFPKSLLQKAKVIKQ